MTCINNIEPAFGPNGVAVAFAADGGYAPYLAAALASIVRHGNPARLYDVIILATGLGEEDQRKLASITEGRANFSLRFCDVQEEVKAATGDFFLSAHISPATYYRLFAPSLFPNYAKLLYLDCDIIALADVARLYDSDLGGRAIGAVRDFYAIVDLPRKASAKWAGQLAMGDTKGYFNAGVLLLDLAKMRAHGYEAKWFGRLREVKTPRLHDQDILNHTLEGDVAYLEAGWNSLAWVESLGERLCPGDLPADLVADYRASLEAPKILHFTSQHKPWNLPHLPLAEKFWERAAETPYYQRLVFDNLRRLNAESAVFKGRLHCPPLALKYGFYRLMASLAGGEKKARYERRAFKIKMNYLERRRLIKAA